MRYVNGLIGVALIVLALSYLSETDAVPWSLIYGYGALVALLSLKSRITYPVAWIGAIGATVAMFCYFALFFQMVPHLRGDWVFQGHESIYLVAAAFCMIPVLSNFSCRLKGDRGLKTAENTFKVRRIFQLPFRPFGRSSGEPHAHPGWKPREARPSPGFARAPARGRMGA